MSEETKAPTGRIVLTISTAVTKTQANEIYAAMINGDMTTLGTVLDSATKEWSDLQVVGDNSKGVATETPQLSIMIADEKLQMQGPAGRPERPMR
jgi:hypothetical protein